MSKDWHITIAAIEDLEVIVMPIQEAATVLLASGPHRWPRGRDSGSRSIIYLSQQSAIVRCDLLTTEVSAFDRARFDSYRLRHQFTPEAMEDDSRKGSPRTFSSKGCARR